MTRRALLLAAVVMGGLVWWALAGAGGDATAASTAEPAPETVADAGEPELGSEPETAPLPAPLPAPPAAPSCIIGDEPAPAAELSLWPYTVLDTRFRLPADYHPDDLVELAQVMGGIITGGGPSPFTPGQQVRSVMVDDLRALFTAAEAAGQQLAVQSAYRSYSYQENTFAYWVELQGYDAALLSSARAGHSEHQLGTTLDFRSRHGPAAWDLADWAETSEGAYLAANAWRYGFVMSYPKDAQAESCYSYEPWHYRYLGRELAAQVHASGLTPRILLWRLAQELDEPSQ